MRRALLMTRLPAAIALTIYGGPLAGPGAARPKIPYLLVGPGIRLRTAPDKATTDRIRTFLSWYELYTL